MDFTEFLYSLHPMDLATNARYMSDHDATSLFLSFAVTVAVGLSTVAVLTWSVLKFRQYFYIKKDVFISKKEEDMEDGGTRATPPSMMESSLDRRRREGVDETQSIFCLSQKQQKVQEKTTALNNKKEKKQRIVESSSGGGVDDTKADAVEGILEKVALANDESKKKTSRDGAMISSEGAPEEKEEVDETQKPIREVQQLSRSGDNVEGGGEEEVKKGEESNPNNIAVSLLVDDGSLSNQPPDICGDDDNLGHVDSTPHAPPRSISRAAQKIIVEKAKRLQCSGDARSALTNYLALLFNSVDAQSESLLPVHLTECLRGAADCYRALGQPQHAVQFLQAERLVFEEVVASSELKHKAPSPPPNSILAALLRPKGSGNQPQEETNHRLTTLSAVADALGKDGRHEVSLAYRLKAAAIKQKLVSEGKLKGALTLDENSPEFGALAESLAKLSDVSKGKVQSEVMEGGPAAE